MDKAVKLATQNAADPGIKAFGAFGGGKLRYNTGSHVDVNGFSLVTGASYGTDISLGRMTFGGFFEYGNGDYDSYNSFANGTVHGSGDTNYVGGGLLSRLDFSNGFYAEVSGRIGSMESDFSSDDIRDFSGTRASYETSSSYYGFHLGTGYLWNITDNTELDLYAKYAWTRQEGDKVKLSTGDIVTFDDVDSNRARLGARFSYAATEKLSPYIGAAWEHEFNGKASATAYGLKLDAPSTKGSTGVGEIGLSIKPSSTLPLSVELGVQGYVGKREGITGSLQLKFEF
jgi:outer membrane autotransporter protein